MVILFKKAMRAMWQNKAAYIACIALISVGVMIYVSLGIANDALSVSAENYYAKHRFADVFARVQGMPMNAVDDLRKMEFVEDVMGRYVYDARAVLPDNDNIITLRFSSVDLSIENPINGYGFTGRDFQYSSDIMVGEDFLKNNGLELGDSITIIANGIRHEFTICAFVESPEYCYAVKDIMEMIPDPETFGFAYITQESLFALTNQYGIYNDIVFQLKEGYKFDDIKTEIEDRLANYNVMQLYDYEDQISYAMLKQELDSTASMTNTIPFVFMFMAIVILYLMLKRMIEQDRSQIGTLKAFGYSNAKIISHYMCYGLITGVTGGIIGDITGYFLSGAYFDLYSFYFKLPQLGVHISPRFLVIGIAIAVLSGIAGSFLGARSVLKLNPAEAMRPVAPPIYKNDVLKKLPFIYFLLNSNGNMAVRSLIRNKFRSFVIILGIMFSFGLLVFIASFDSIFDDMLINQFTKTQLFNSKITFNNPQDYTVAVEGGLSLKGVKYAEGIMEIPVELKYRNKTKGIFITGIEADSTLYKIYDNEKLYNLTPPTEGIIINDGLAKSLDVKKGDIVYLNSPLLEDDIKIIISDVAVQNLGLNAYMEINALAKTFNLRKSATSIIMDSDDMGYLKEYLFSAGNVAAITDSERSIELYSDMLETYSSLFYILDIFAIAVAFAIVSNTASISLSERKREFATLRVVGLHVKEVANIMGFEYWTLCILGMLAGIPFSQFLKVLIASTMESDLFTFPTRTPLTALMAGAVGCILAVYISNRSAVKKIRKFDMVEVLKERE